MTKIRENIILTTMTMVYNEKGEMLVILRTKNDWPGLTFPGGHVELGEDLETSAKREVLEETGLTLNSLECVGAYSWTIFGPNQRDLVILYRSDDYFGKLHSSNEGNVFFIPINKYRDYPLSHDFEPIYQIMIKGLS